MLPVFTEFPDVQLLHNVVKMCETYPELIPEGQITYRAKPKLHGCNAGITIRNKEFVAQSRSQIITPENDYAGFARWAHSHADYWKALSDMTIFGEWCGKGVVPKSKGTAIGNVPDKIFAVFAIIGNFETAHLKADMPVEERFFFEMPAAIEALLNLDRSGGNDLPAKPSNLYVVPHFGGKYSVDFRDKVALPSLAESLNKVLEEIEPRDPWVCDTFGVEGTAEGLVYYPRITEGPRTMTAWLFEHFAFKVKGEKHRVMKTREAVQIDPEVVASTAEFVAKFVTEARCEQGTQSMEHPLNVRNTKKFIDWMTTDVQKESKDELEAAGLTWEQVKSSVEAAARGWFIGKTKGA